MWPRSEMSDHRRPDDFGVENVGGYRLIRKLGDGERAEVWLGHSAHSASAGSGADDPGSEVIAVKLYRSDVTLRSIDEEIETLARAKSAHIVELRDIASATDGRPCLILGRLPNGSLDQLFSRRTAFSAGELVTALAPVVAAVAEVHRLGIAHGGVRAGAVLLDERRAPVLAGFGASRVIGDPPADNSFQSLTLAQRSVDDAIRADVEGLATLVRSFAGRVSTPDACGSLLEWLGTEPRSDNTLSQLTDRIYDLADAAPLDATDREREPAITSRSSSERPFALSGRPQPESAGGAIVSPVSATVPFTAGRVRAERDRVLTWLEQAVSESPGKAIAGRLAAVVATVRRPVWIAAGFGCAALILAIGVIPSLASADPSPTGTSTGTTARAPLSDPRSTESVTPIDPALDSDDPIAAARALVVLRARCIAQRSTGCLDTVEQTDSAALEADRYFLRQLQGGSDVKDRKLDDSAFSLVQRLGDSAIIGLGQSSAEATYTSSVLIVKVGKNWRIRDLTTGAAP